MQSKKYFLSSFLLFVLLSSLIIIVNAEPSWVSWSQTYGGTSEEGMAGLHNVHLVRTSDIGFALAGD
jgi:hypothetical protein